MPKTSLLVILLALSACVAPAKKEPTGKKVGPVTAVRDAHIQGEIGPTLLHDDARGSVYDDGWYLSVESVVAFEDGAAMALFTMTGDTISLRPGFEESFDFTTSDATLLGCVGQEEGIYDIYDAPATEVDVVATSAGEDTDVLVTGRWFDQDQNGHRLETFREADVSFTLVR